MSLWRKRNNVHHNEQNQPKWFNMIALANNDLSIKSKEHMTPEEEFNCKEMESKVKQDYVTAIKERTWSGLTDEVIIELAKNHCSGYEFENGDVYDCYKFSKEELIAFAQLIADKGCL